MHEVSNRWIFRGGVCGEGSCSRQQANEELQIRDSRSKYSKAGKGGRAIILSYCCLSFIRV